MTIRQMCDTYEVTPRTLRFYEAKGTAFPDPAGHQAAVHAPRPGPAEADPARQALRVQRWRRSGSFSTYMTWATSKRPSLPKPTNWQPNDWPTWCINAKNSTRRSRISRTQLKWGEKRLAELHADVGRGVDFHDRTPEGRNAMPSYTAPVNDIQFVLHSASESQRTGHSRL